MRWLKHMTATPQDEKISRLIAEYGHAGYGVWWLVLEIVARGLEGSREPSVTYPISTWAHLLFIRGSHVVQTLVKLQLTYLVTLERSGDDITVTIPNLLKYRDEYSRKSGHYQDSVRTKEQIQIQREIQIQSTSTKAVEGELELTTPTNGSAPKRKLSPATLERNAKLKAQQKIWFEEFKRLFIWKWEGEDSAWKIFSWKVKTDEVWTEIRTAVVAQTREQMDRVEQYRICPTKWLMDGRWKDKPAPALFTRPRDVI